MSDMKSKLKRRDVRIAYTVTLAGKRGIRKFVSEKTIMDLVGYLSRNYFTLSDLVKVTKTTYTTNQYDSTYESFEETVDITDKVISDTIPKLLGKRAEKINFDKLELLK